MGDERVTVQNLQVLQVREADKVILISGAVPGANGSYVVVRPAIKHPEKFARCMPNIEARRGRGGEEARHNRSIIWPQKF